MKQVHFQPGDVVLVDGETYQVIEALGATARVVPFPADEVAPQELELGPGARRIGHAPLPGPTPCSSDGCCPTGGNPVGDDEIGPRR